MIKPSSCLKFCYNTGIHKTFNGLANQRQTGRRRRIHAIDVVKTKQTGKSAEDDLPWLGGHLHSSTWVVDENHSTLQCPVVGSRLPVERLLSTSLRRHSCKNRTTLVVSDNFSTLCFDVYKK